MAPEQLRAEPVDARADQCAWGVVAYELLSGRRPWEASGGGYALAAEIMTREPPRLRTVAPGVPSRVESVVARAMSKSPAARFASMGELLVALEGPMQSHRGRLWASAVAVVATLVVLVSLWGERARTRVAAARGTATTPSSAPAIVTVLDLPAPASSSVEALSAYEDGVRAVRDGNWAHARAFFARALEADPRLAAAHLRLAMTSSGTIGTITQTHIELQKAAELRERLSARDRVLLDALEPMLARTPSDRTASAARLRVALERYPNDAELLWWLGSAYMDLTGFGDASLALPAFARAAALDPGYADAWEEQGRALAWLGRSDDARSVFETCLAIPTAVDCLFWLQFLDASRGDCAACERDARRRIDRDALSVVGPRDLANALLALGQPSEGAHTALEQSWKLWNEPDRGREQLGDEADLRAVQGDFTGARDLAERELAVVEADPEGARHFRATKMLMELALERGDRKSAGALADAFVRRAPAWTTAGRAFDRGGDGRPWALAVARRDGTLPAADFETMRGAWAQGLGTGADASGYAWVLGWAATAEAPDEAREALAQLARFGPLPPAFPGAGNAELIVGRVLARANRRDEAEPHLVRATRHCARLVDPFAHPRAELELGLLREAQGDVAGACTAYQAVLAQWGSTEPLSVTAARARQRVRAIACAK
jgi:serine/threonine-protein kinase